MPTDVTEAVPFDLARAAQELDRLTNQWFEAVASQDVDRDSHVAKLVGRVNEIGKTHFGILGGAVGIVNGATNRLEHYKYYPGDERKTPLFPYSDPPASLRGGVYSILAPILKDHDLESSHWLNGLFEVRRRHQDARVSESALLTGADPTLCLGPTEICAKIQEWIDVLAVAKYMHRYYPGVDLLTAPFDVSLSKLESRMSPNFRTSPEWKGFEGRTSLLDCLESLVSLDGFNTGWPNSVEVIFVGHQQDDAIPQLYDELRVKDVLRQFCDKLKLRDIRFWLGRQPSHPWPPHLRARTIPEVLQTLHRAPLPLVEYLVLILLWHEHCHVYHIVWPFVKTSTYHPGEKKDRFSFTGLLLLTFQTQPHQWWSRAEVIEHLSPFALLMRVALEPIADRVFYGSIYRNRVMLEQTTANLKAISHELKDVVEAIPAAAGKPFLLEGIRRYLLTVSLPSAGALDELVDVPLLAAAVKGTDDVDTLLPNYKQWLTSLITLACEIHVVAKLGPLGLIGTPDHLQQWTQVLAGYFSFAQEGEGFSHLAVPRELSTRCYLSLAILCALRNVLKHTVTVSVDRTSHPPITTWMLKAGCGPKVDVGLIQGTVSGERWLSVTNSSTSSSKKTPRPEAGTVQAIDYYLGEIHTQGGHTLRCSWKHDKVNGSWAFELPVIL